MNSKLLTQLKISFHVTDTCDLMAGELVLASLSQLNPRPYDYELTDVRNVLTQLVSNVKQHAYGGIEAGEVLITLKLYADAALSITVKDKGKGIPEDTLHVLLDSIHSKKPDILPENSVMGTGFAYIKLVMPEITIHSNSNGTEVTVKKVLQLKNVEK